MVQANGIIEGMRRGRSHLADQFTRASLSIVLNLAEGAGKHGLVKSNGAARVSKARMGRLAERSRGQASHWDALRQAGLLDVRTPRA